MKSHMTSGTCNVHSRAGLRCASLYATLNKEKCQMVGNNDPARGRPDALGRWRWPAPSEPVDAWSRSRLQLTNSNRNKVRIEFPVTH
jgi:hypothetical protein